MWTSFRDFAQRYRRSRAGLAGVAILLSFIVVALLAPVMTPHDPQLTMQLASSRAPPEWLDAARPRNIYPVSDPGFATLDALDEWTIATSSAVVVGWSATEGYPGIPHVEEGSGPGAITCTASSSLPQNHTATLERTFDYTYAPPRRFSVHLAYRAEVQGNAEWSIRVLVRQTTGDTLLLYELTEESGSVEWSVPKPPIDTNNAILRFRLFQDILADAKRIFTTHGTYVLVVQLSITTENSTATVYLDDLSARIWAEAYGLLGTDNYGRDLFTQLIYGSRISIIIGVFSALIAVLLGLIVGLSAGYIGGWFDELLMRTNDILLTIPGLPFLIVLTAVIGPTIWAVIVLIGLLGWMGIARLIRSQVLTFKTKAFVEAAKATGGGTWHIIRRHLVPNVMTMAYTQLALTVPGAIVTEAALSFLGLGDPFLQTWGKMLHDVQYYGAISEWWWALPPGICIALLSMSFVFIGYALDEILNPKLRQR
jgi:peptide/nickel transport system permease protein